MIVIAGLAMSVLAAPLSAQSMKEAADWSGTWSGRYVCAQGTTGLALTIQRGEANAVVAHFSFYALPENPQAASGQFTMRGRVDAADPDRLHLVAGQWLQRPAGYVTVDLDGRFNSESGEYRGRVGGPGCSGFVLRRDPLS
ncbi:MAG: hypothetical protein IKE60_07470 [Reyranella sp.]|jgi:hypothetical protein|uniref:hypothetical protein n=1 Tax=Reyranella sp. TaxID=1929291 RepID=UPI002600AC46|nr:hypothetical protein [Reyranella sp.]MBR2814475.1 hypothetical protein [Reyranella sp.]